MPRDPVFDIRDFTGAHGADIRPALLREITGLYLQKPSHTLEEERLFTELALRLIDHVDSAERAWLGAQLAAYPGAPLAVIRRLAQPDPLAPDAQQPSQLDLQAANLPRIEERTNDETLSGAFFNALPDERRLILLHLDYAPVAPASIAVMVDAATRIERAAMTRRRDHFTAALEQMLAISPACAGRIADDSTGEAVVAALKALAIPSPAVQRILLFLNASIGQSTEVYFSLVRLYDEITEDAARRLVAIWRRDDARPPRSGEYEPQFVEDRSAQARDFARHDARPAAGHPQTKEELPRQRQRRE